MNFIKVSCLTAQAQCLTNWEAIVGLTAYSSLSNVNYTSSGSMLL